MEAEAITHAIQWIGSQRAAQITHATILTDSLNLKVESGMGWHTADWHTVFGYNDLCGSTDLGTPESVGMKGR